MAQAACANEPTDLFFPPDTGDSHVVVAAAKAICAECGVREACLAYAMKNHEPSGVWGGTSAPDRRRLARNIAQQRRRGAQACG